MKIPSILIYEFPLISPKIDWVPPGFEASPGALVCVIRNLDPIIICNIVAMSAEAALIRRILWALKFSERRTGMA